VPSVQSQALEARHRPLGGMTGRSRKGRLGSNTE
jgi:hypothetical protein